MKYKVLNKFRDKYTKKIYPVGKEIELTEERAKEVLEKDSTFIEAVNEEDGSNEENESGKPGTTEEPDIDEEDKEVVNTENEEKPKKKVTKKVTKTNK